MSVIAGSTILASDVVSTSAGSGDSGKIPKLSSDGKIHRSMVRGAFGGTGADGALSGTTVIDLGSAQLVVKNYTSISLTGTETLTFTNPHANGTVIIFKSQGDVTITSTATRAIDLRSLGSLYGTAQSGTGRGGRGAGAFYVECAGALNYTGAIDASGENGTANSGGSAIGNNGGGGGGIVVLLANSITANTGTTTITGGAAAGAQGGGTGGGTLGGNANDAKGVHGIFKGGVGGGNSSTTVSTVFGIVPSINTIATKYVPLIPGSGGGGGGHNAIDATNGEGIGGGVTGVAISGLNNEFA